jgi:hypothetical protein
MCKMKLISNHLHKLNALDLFQGQKATLEWKKHTSQHV